MDCALNRQSILSRHPPSSSFFFIFQSSTPFIQPSFQASSPFPTLSFFFSLSHTWCKFQWGWNKWPLKSWIVTDIGYIRKCKTQAKRVICLTCGKTDSIKSLKKSFPYICQMLKLSFFFFLSVTELGIIVAQCKTEKLKRIQLSAHSSKIHYLPLYGGPLVRMAWVTYRSKEALLSCLLL